MSQSPRRHLNWKAILSGFALNEGGFLVVGMMIAAVLFMPALKSSPEMVEQIGARLYSSSIFLGFFLALSAVFIIAGAYLAAHMAPGDEIRHALCVGVISFLIRVVSLFSDSDSAQIWYNIAGFALILPCAYLGGTLRRIRPRRAPLDPISRPPIPLP